MVSLLQESLHKASCTTRMVSLEIRAVNLAALVLDWTCVSNALVATVPREQIVRFASPLPPVVLFVMQKG